MTKTTNANTISIIVASDNHYSILIAALLKSIELNHKTDEHINFYIIDDNISAGNKRKLISVADPTRISITWIPRKHAIPDGFSIPVDRSSMALTTYYRIFTPYLVDQTIGKLLYIDVDVIFRSDVSDLWKIDIGDYTLGAVQDIGKYVENQWGGIPNYKALGLSNDTKYFNAGVLLINAKKWREQNVSAKIIEILIKYKEHVVLGDQYGLNVAFANNWYELDERWNWSAGGYHDSPFLVHFLHIKPIFKSCYSKDKWKAEFFEYLSQTPWKNYKPVSENWRRFRLGYNKAKKTLMRLLN